MLRLAAPRGRDHHCVVSVRFLGIPGAAVIQIIMNWAPCSLPAFGGREGRVKLEIASGSGLLKGNPATYRCLPVLVLHDFWGGEEKGKSYPRGRVGFGLVGWKTTITRIN